MTGGLHGGPTSASLAVEALARYPHRTAFVHGERHLTYGEALALTWRLTRALIALGLGPGDGLAYLTVNRPEAYLLSVAGLVAGCRVTPLHPLGSAEDHRFMAADSEVRLVVADDVFADRLRDLGAAGPERALGLDELLALADRQPAEPVACVPDEDDLALLLYTGGTTGRPKGVMLSHRALVHTTWLTATGWEWPERIRFLACTPMSHGVGAMVGPVLLRGGTVVIVNGFDPERLLATIEAERITATFLVPTMLYMMLDLPGAGRYDLTSLKTVIYGAAPMSPGRLAEAIDRIGPVFQQLYAQSEAPNTVAALLKDDHDLARPHLLASAGRPLPGVEVAVLDDDGAEVAVGEVGEICVRGRLVMDGYWRAPELTDEALRGGWLHTGDLARCDAEGFLYIVDRRKDMIVSGGFNVYPREVEDVLGGHPEVAMAAVVGVPHAKWGEAVKAFVVARDGAVPDLDELRALVRERKGPVHVPKEIEVVDALPLTVLGKPDKRVLRDRAWAGSERGVG